jgi:hypothetical protein
MKTVVTNDWPDGLLIVKSVDDRSAEDRLKPIPPLVEICPSID